MGVGGTGKLNQAKEKSYAPSQQGGKISHGIKNIANQAKRNRDWRSNMLKGSIHI